MDRTAGFFVLAAWFCFAAACGGGNGNPSPDDGGDDAGQDSGGDANGGSDATRDARSDATADGGDATTVDASDASDAGDSSSVSDGGAGEAATEGGDADASDAATLDATDAGEDGDAGDGAAPDAGDGGIVLGWRPLAHQPPFLTDTELLLTDGTVMVHASDDPSAWWRLTPDQNGNYASGTWTQLASLPAGYGPTYFASAVLPDGRVIVEGGEYNGDGGSPVETKLGAIYDPLTDAWTPVAAPPGWGSIGDAPGAVLANGVFMMGNATTAQQALFDAGTLGWTTTGTGKADPNSEEGWTLLPDGKLLTLDCSNGTHSEIYDPGSGAWTSAGNVGVVLVAQVEIGPAMLLPNGDVLATGATAHTAVLHAGVWSAGPDLPSSKAGQLVLADAPAALLPSGHVIAAASPGVYAYGVTFLDYDGVSFTPIADIPNAAIDQNYSVRLLVLPTGEVLELDGTLDAEIYSAAGSPDPSWRPTISSVPSVAVRGSTYVVHGTQLNGLSQAEQFGDDVQQATNYPLVRLTNQATGHVFYARTHDFSTMGVATGKQDVSASFDVPMGAETGPTTLVVVANGIPSDAVSLIVL